MPQLRDRLVTFIAALRDAGVRISVAESIDAMNAVAAVGLERARMHEALAAALIKDEADRAIFDEAFNRFFAAPRAHRGEHPDQRGDQISAAAARGRPGENPSPRDDAPPRKAEQPREGALASNPNEKSSPSEAKPSTKTSAAAHRDDAEGKDAGRDSDKVSGREERGHEDIRAESPTPGIDAARVARLRAIERMPFDRFSDLDYDEAREALAPLVRRFRIRLGRRLRLAKTGRIDFRRTIRAAMQRGGTLLDLNFRARMLPPRQQFRVRRSSGRSRLRESPPGDDARARPLRAIGFRPRAGRAVAAQSGIADAQHDRRDHGRRPQQSPARARRRDPRNRAHVSRRGLAESRRSRALGYRRQRDQAVRARSEGRGAVAKPARTSTRAGRDRLALQKSNSSRILLSSHRCGPPLPSSVSPDESFSSRSRLRAAIMSPMLAAASGCSLNRRVNPSRSISITSRSVIARTLALRGSPVISAISPVITPRPISARWRTWPSAV